MDLDIATCSHIIAHMDHGYESMSAYLSLYIRYGSWLHVHIVFHSPGYGYDSMSVILLLILDMAPLSTY